MPKLSLGLNPIARYELTGIILFALGVFVGLSLLGFSTGPVGSFTAKVLVNLLGVGAPAVPLFLVAIGSRYVFRPAKVKYTVRFWGITVFYIGALALYHHFAVPPGREVMPDSLASGGGLVGGLLLFYFRKAVGIYGTLTVLSTLMLCAGLLATSCSLAAMALKLKTAIFCLASRLQKSVRQKPCEPEEEIWNGPDTKKRFYDQEMDNYLAMPPRHEDERDAIPAKMSAIPEDKPGIAASQGPSIPENEPGPALYSYPPVSLLRKGKVKSARMQKEIIDNAKILEDTLESFGIGAKVINASQGPTVTRYELEPASGVKVSRIVSLADDLALKLAAPGVRIEAPIPGKAAVGIEVPNKEAGSVFLREVIESEEFIRSGSKLTIALGKDIAGQPVIADLGKMPHVLVAGATGSGKSVCLNTLIVSILYKALPSEVKLILVDPKMVELSSYAGIPHLMAPVVTDAKKAATTLRWAVQEMERRYSLFANAGTRDIFRFNELAKDPKQKLPLIVIIIDELADLMMVAPVDVEDTICRLAQMARAAGIHLVLATQRPSVDVITGTIKANITSRISFLVSSQVDSRTILDMPGAEKLLGKGDMLYLPAGASKPLRVQGAFVTDTEVEEVVSYIKRQGTPEYSSSLAAMPDSEEKPGAEQFEDELLEEAIRLVLETRQASASMLQRRFRIGYTRAARLIDIMENMRIVGPNTGSKPREILAGAEQVAKYLR